MARPPSANLVGREEELSWSPRAPGRCGTGRALPHPRLRRARGGQDAPRRRGRRRGARARHAGPGGRLPAAQRRGVPLRAARRRAARHGARRGARGGARPAAARAAARRSRASCPSCRRRRALARRRSCRAPSARAACFELLLRCCGGSRTGRRCCSSSTTPSWSDTSTRDFITYLAHNLIAERIAAVVAHRTLRRRDPVRRRGRGAHPPGGGHAPRARPARARRDRAPRRRPRGRRRRQALVDEVFARSGGIPFYAGGGPRRAAGRRGRRAPRPPRRAAHPARRPPGRGAAAARRPRGARPRGRRDAARRGRSASRRRRCRTRCAPRWTSTCSSATPMTASTSATP